MSKQWRGGAIFTVPNAMSAARLALIPVFLWLYCREELYVWAAAVLALSGITDILDGWVARQFNQVSDAGKILDPVADKLTQAALILSLAGHYSRIWLLFALFAAKEFLVGAAGLAAMMKANTVSSARWFGKLTTFVLEVSMGVLVLFPDIPQTANALFALCAMMLLGSMAGYLRYDLRLLRGASAPPAKKEKKPAA